MDDKIGPIISISVVTLCILLWLYFGYIEIHEEIYGQPKFNNNCLPSQQIGGYCN